MLDFIISFLSLGNLIFFWMNFLLSMTFSSAKFFKHLNLSLLILASASLYCCIRSFYPIVRRLSLVFLKNFCVFANVLDESSTLWLLDYSNFYSSMTMGSGLGTRLFLSSSDSYSCCMLAWLFTLLSAAFFSSRMRFIFA
jgi:hypothetical protein